MRGDSWWYEISSQPVLLLARAITERTGVRVRVSRDYTSLVAHYWIDAENGEVISTLPEYFTPEQLDCVVESIRLKEVFEK